MRNCWLQLSPNWSSQAFLRAAVLQADMQGSSARAGWSLLSRRPMRRLPRRAPHWEPGAGRRSQAAGTPLCKARAGIPAMQSSASGQALLHRPGHQQLGQASHLMSPICILTYWFTGLKLEDVLLVISKIAVYQHRFLSPSASVGSSSSQFNLKAKSARGLLLQATLSQSFWQETAMISKQATNRYWSRAQVSSAPSPTALPVCKPSLSQRRLRSTRTNGVRQLPPHPPRTKRTPTRHTRCPDLLTRLGAKQTV